MKLAFDVYYENDKEDNGKDVVAKVAAIGFHQWTDDTPCAIFTDIKYDVAPYISGQFYKRELPCILQLCEKFKIQPECFIVDGYVHLQEERVPALGHHLAKAFDFKIPVIGVAKKKHLNTPDDWAITRGVSKNPLYVTAIGMDQRAAKQYIQQMHGAFREPTLLKLADAKCRQIK